MDKFKLGAFGCALGFAAGLLWLAGARGAAAAGPLAYAAAIAGAGMVMAATLALRRKFSFRLFLLGGALAAAGVVATLLTTLGVLHAAATRDINAISSAFVGFLVASGVAALGWMFIGASLLLKRRAVAAALGEGQGVLVLATGVLLVLTPLLGPTPVGPIGLLPLAFILFGLARAPAAPAAA